MGGGWFIWELSLCCLNSEKDFLKSWTFWLKDWPPADNTCPEKNLGQECLRKMQKCASFFWIRKRWKRKMLRGYRIFLWKRKYQSLVTIPGFWYVGYQSLTLLLFYQSLFPSISQPIRNCCLSEACFLSRPSDSRYPPWSPTVSNVSSLMLSHQLPLSNIICLLCHLFRPRLLTWNSCKGFLGPFQGIASVVYNALFLF